MRITPSTVTFAGFIVGLFLVLGIMLMNITETEAKQMEQNAAMMLAIFRGK